MNILRYITSVSDTSQLNTFYKVLFIISNFIYFVPIILYDINEITVISLVIGLISIIFHTCQCMNHTSLKTKVMVYFDIIFSVSLFSYILYKMHKELPLWWYLLLIISIIIFLFGSSKYGSHIYVLLHSIWHILTGILLIYVSHIYTQ